MLRAIQTCQVEIWRSHYCCSCLLVTCCWLSVSVFVCVSASLTGFCVSLGFVLQRLHHILNPPQLLLDLDVFLAGRLRLHTHTPQLNVYWSHFKYTLYWQKSLVFGDEFVSHLKSHQRCSAAFCRPVKFFHTDWIIISLWFLSYTQRHCDVRIEKGLVQTVAIKLEAHNSLEYHYMLKY